MKIRVVIAIALGLLLAAGGYMPSISRAASPQSDVKLPETAVGKTFKAFIEAFNSGDINKMRAFHKGLGGNEENAEKDLGFYQQSGGLRLISIAASEEYEITVIAETKSEGMKVRFNMTVDSQAPHAIKGIRVEPEQ